MKQVTFRVGAPASWRYLATALVLAATLGASLYSERRKPELLARPLETIPADLGGWIGTDDPPITAPVLAKLLPTSYVTRTYQKDGRRLGLFIAYYAQQRAGENMHSPKHCLPGSGWEIWKYGTVDVPVGERKFTINRYSIQNGANRQVILYWYQSRRRIIASEYLGKIMLVRDALLEGGTAGSIVRISVPDERAAVADGIAFASRLIPTLETCFGSAN